MSREEGDGAESVRVSNVCVARRVIVPVSSSVQLLVAGISCTCTMRLPSQPMVYTTDIT